MTGGDSSGRTATPSLAGGETIAALRLHDRAATALGPVEGWPAELTSLACLVLEAQLPMALVWGEAPVTICNDALRATLGGSPSDHSFGGAWEGIGPLVARAMAGEASLVEDCALSVERHGFPDDAWFALSCAPVRLADGRVHGAVVTVMETSAAVQARRRAAMVTSELGHRLKNSMAMVQAIAVQSLRQVSERELVDAFADRVAALGRAHDVLLRERWDRSPIAAVVAQAMAAHASARVTATGPELELGPKAVLSVAMLLHELATNAVKYGALSGEIGQVAIAWRQEGAELVLTWDEHGGPPVPEPTRTGFGSRLINMGLVGTGHVHKRYGYAGLSVEFRALLQQLLQA